MMGSEQVPTAAGSPEAHVKKMHMRAVFLLLVLVAIPGALTLTSNKAAERKLRLDEFEQKLADGDIVNAKIHDRSDVVTGEFSSGATRVHFRTPFPAQYSDELTTAIRAKNVKLEVDNERPNAWFDALFTFAPFLLMIGFFVWMARSARGGPGGIMQFGKSKAKVLGKESPRVLFSDVAGVDEAVEELREIKDFLADPAKFAHIGARVPRGVLLFGPPGTGKTLLARAVAGEAGVPFFSISGSDFVEMFVGVGASRVRDLFEQAKAAAPAIIFVDEIDAVGRHRGAGMGGGHDEREQTLNQLLVEMDGFDPRTGVILIAGTNRPDILDPALLRPGRFDRQILVDRPDLPGRRGILAVHAKGKPLGPGVDLDVLAKRTPGFTGADLANLLNEAALLTARRNKTVIGQDELEAAIDRVMAGPEKKSKVMSEHDRFTIAVHEAGHAIVGHVLAGCDPIHKVSIIARGRALGWTLALPEADKILQTRAALTDELAMLLGGRTAEEVVIGEITTGAQNDIERATGVARAMVTEFGMSDSLGLIQLGTKNGEVFLGRDFGSAPNYSSEIAAKIDHEVRRIIDRAHDTATQIISTHRDVFDRLVETLLAKETIDKTDLEPILGNLPTWTTPTPTPTTTPQPEPTPHHQPQLQPVAAATTPPPEVSVRRNGRLRHALGAMKQGWQGPNDDPTPPTGPAGRPRPQPGFGPATSA